MRSRVYQDGPAVLTLLRRGVTATEAAAATGVNVNTIRAWIRRYEEFGAAAGGRASRPPLTAVDGRASLPDRRELLELLAEQARRGSVRAVELLLRERPSEPEPVDDEVWRRLMAVPNLDAEGA